jgi:hypothetical protein
LLRVLGSDVRQYSGCKGGKRQIVPAAATTAAKQRQCSWVLHCLDDCGAAAQSRQRGTVAGALVRWIRLLIAPPLDGTSDGQAHVAPFLFLRGFASGGG